MEAEMLQQKMLSSNWLKIAFLFAIVVGVPHAASALPKQGAGQACSCICFVPLGYPADSLVAVMNYNSSNHQCYLFNGKTCNLENPNTGGVSSGRLSNCLNGASVIARPVMIRPPFSGVTLAPSH
jgi:hypothetical protein